jgi:ATP-dependent helicase/nuclease subunit B
LSAIAVRRPRVFTIPPSAPFLPTLIGALVEGRLVPGFPAATDPLALATVTIYLPTRRACRLARDLFLEALGRDAAVLPRLAALGDVDEDELAFADAAEGMSPGAAIDLAETLDRLERRLLLAQLILQWARARGVRTEADAPLVAGGPATALALADDLAHLMDDMTTRAVPWERLEALVPDHVSAYWQLTLEFLKIARETWPAILAERDLIEPAARRDRLIAAEAARLSAAAGGPVVAAGSTASIPATAELLATIAQLPHGAVVLPGLDTELDEPSWDLIGGARDRAGRIVLPPAAGHPQFALHAFLARIKMRREEVHALAPAAAHGRERLLSEALRPAAATDRWRERLRGDHIGRAVERVALIEAAQPAEEALAIAVALREAVEDPQAIAALVTPDRGLARRVVAALGRWNVAVDDTGGEPLADAPAGVFGRLAAEVALGGVEPVALLALLKHPLLRLGLSAARRRRAVAALERAVLRGPRPQPGTAGLVQALTTFEQNRHALHGSDPRRRIWDRHLDEALDLVARLGAALAPLETIAGLDCALAELTARHRQVLAALLRNGDETIDGISMPDGAELLTLFDDLAESEAAKAFVLDTREYGQFLHATMAARIVRQPLAADARVRIFGLLEARLHHVDRLVLGGLVEGVWPPQTRSDPWLSRPMRHELGLDLPERRIGLTAHDFAQALGAREAVLTRSTKVAGTPTVASRFLQRLEAVCGEAHWNDVRDRGARYVELARSLDRPRRVAAIKPPAPCPPRDARPTRLSVTEVEHWLRDPYTIYAKHVLRLAPLDPVDTPPGARDRGTVIHAAIADFSQAFAGGLPADPLAELLARGRQYFAPLAAFPEARAFWWPRFERIARWFADWEAARRRNLVTVHAEIRGEIAIPAGDRTFRLTAIADRIERHQDETYALLDYKTGRVPSDKQVRVGVSPQLTLESVILRTGGFPGIPAGGSIGQLAYVALKGGDPAGQAQSIDLKDRTADQHADAAFERLAALVWRFEQEAQGYPSLLRPMWRNSYGDYDHLARVKEWSATGGELEEGPE